LLSVIFTLGFLLIAGGWPPGLLWATAAAAFGLHAIELSQRRITVGPQGIEVHQWLRRQVIDRDAIARTSACFNSETGEWWPFLVVHLWEGKRIHLALDIFSPADQRALRDSPWLRLEPEALEPLPNDAG
jgi:hypothetical protein